ncbi:hypothetical protein ABZU09_07925 [Lactobacillus mulieris]|jgi:hypothetical protein|uniref:hypothetical protein n=1 Tax=Lactobacillus TaxID=1578 RepID=UPI00019C84C1|nr:MULTISPECIES: hypothetical protein [Lactobacillus]EEU21338.1 hypothetical protein HMPREF0525_00272 [Lactobacillus jensenii 27-2-CHN]EEX24209.1 hypothetical protein HMPREF0974_00014 [Lactobacillus jensenii 115-3-CHN]EFH29376.1 hypothetical protein HMPREF0526_10979 [Lactobacillus jensenii JV-V16]MCF1847534.1 hypothetical protein [Lactobacillus mulieris]MCW8073635.1 hypothetical protein [Lactobacillus mulieris]
MASITKRGKVWQARYSKRVKKLVKQPDGSVKYKSVHEQKSKSGFTIKKAVM